MGDERKTVTADVPEPKPGETPEPDQTIGDVAAEQAKQAEAAEAERRRREQEEEDLKRSR